MVLDFEDIIITDAFLKHPPKAKKLNKEKKHFSETGSISRTIRVNDKNELIDGYTSYLTLKDINFYGPVNVAVGEDASYKNKPTAYVFAKHPGVDVEYVWRYRDSWHGYASPGDLIIVSTKFGLAPAIVSRVEVLDTPPFDGRIKVVVRNGNIENKH